MFFNYFKVAVRSLVRNKSYAIINVLGLSVAFASCILTFLFVRNDYSVNRVIPDWSRICRMEAIGIRRIGPPGNTLAPVVR